MFSERGLSGATIDDVRRLSGASIGSIYHHFGDKEGIADALYADGLRDYQGGFLAVLAADADLEWLMVDSTIVRAHQHAAGARRSKGGLMPKGWAAPAAA